MVDKLKDRDMLSKQVERSLIDIFGSLLIGEDEFLIDKLEVKAQYYLSAHILLEIWYEHLFATYPILDQPTDNHKNIRYG